jgi:hypothetical protein
MSTVVMTEAHYLSTVQGNINKTLLLTSSEERTNQKLLLSVSENITILGSSKKKKSWECKTLQGNENMIGGN